MTSDQKQRLLDDRNYKSREYGTNSWQNHSDGETEARTRRDMRPAASIDEFGEFLQDKTFSNKVTRTGRQRKKLAARTKGGEFEAKRKKRRVNFCCICSELDLEGIKDAILNMHGSRWEAKIYEDVLHLFQYDEKIIVSTSPVNIDEMNPPIVTSSSGRGGETLIRAKSLDESIKDLHRWVNGPDHVTELFPDIQNVALLNPLQTTSVLWSTGAKEVFIYEFGAIVFWGFRKGEEDGLLLLCKQYIEQGEISIEEYDEERDDMAFVTSSEAESITISNDVITLPDDSRAKSRLSVSFAIAQSAVLGIFEARVETKIKEFKYIPETLAANKDLRLTPKKLGAMIGEVYRIRHDVNLHSEILDTPDFFWKEEEAEVIYRLTCRYLELSARTEVLNTRVDMLRELLAVLQQRQDNDSAVKLEWIVIWLIVVSAAIESCAILVTLLKKS